MALQGSWRLKKDETLERTQINLTDDVFLPKEFSGLVTSLYPLVYLLLILVQGGVGAAA